MFHVEQLLLALFHMRRIIKIMTANNYTQERRRFRKQAKCQLVSAGLMGNRYKYVPNVIRLRIPHVIPVIVNFAFDQFIAQPFRWMNMRDPDK